jgi:hypothetical protein
MKVDNHIHLAAAASAKQFVNFVRDKLENEGDTVVMEDGQTLAEVFRRAGLDSDHLTIDAFSVLADYSTYQRFEGGEVGGGLNNNSLSSSSSWRYHSKLSLLFGWFLQKERSVSGMKGQT